MGRDGGLISCLSLCALYNRDGFYLLHSLKAELCIDFARGGGEEVAGRQRDSQREGFRDLWPDSTE